ncbi:MAG: hypothetical protein JWM98_1962, partial [Thermoleophilia bacterium]|nr:hypothetical protein [Thermoleophilia bacterium]
APAEAAASPSAPAAQPASAPSAPAAAPTPAPVAKAATRRPANPSVGVVQDEGISNLMSMFDAVPVSPDDAAADE